MLKSNFRWSSKIQTAGRLVKSKQSRSRVNVEQVVTIIPVPGPTDVTVGLRALDGQLPNDLTAEVEGTLNDMLVENSDELAAPAAEGDSTARITQMDRRTARQALTSALAAVSQGQYG